MDMTIERACAADAKELLAFLRQVGAESDNLTFGAEGPPFTEAEEAEHLASIAHSSDALMLLAKKEGRIIGEATLRRHPRRMSHRGNFSVAVSREFWNAGVGRRLAESVFCFARENGYEIIDLEVRCDNLRAIALYERLGFRRIGTHPAFFRMGGEYVPFDIMYLPLNEG